MPNDRNSIEIYLQYKGYLTAGQLRDILSHFDHLYDALYAGLTHSDPHRMGLQTRLRVSEVRTGNSIILMLAEGVATVMRDGAIIVVPAIGVLSAAAKLLTSAVKGVVETRKAWHEGTKAKYEAEVAKEELRKHQETARVPEPDLRTVPDEAKLAATGSAVQIINLIEYSPNIVSFKVNGEVLISKDETDGTNDRR